MKLFTTLALTASTALISLPALASNTMLSGVKVEANLSSYANNNALEYWPTLEQDLGQAIAEKVQFDDTAKAPSIHVEINKVAVDGDTILPDSGEFNQLEGTVKVFEGLNADATSSEVANSSGAIKGSFPLRLSAQTAEGTPPEGWTLVPPSKDDFYNAMVEAFADEIVDRIETN